jgi:hypothetical protein
MALAVRYVLIGGYKVVKKGFRDGLQKSLDIAEMEKPGVISRPPAFFHVCLSASL